MINLVLCGGSGTRLWPLSRKLLPKQFVKLIENKSLFQRTVERNCPLVNKLLIVANTEHYFLAKDQLAEIPNQDANYLLESVAKNTAPAITLACLSLQAEDILLVTPADHLIQDQTAYQTAVDKAKHLAEQGYLVTFGILPTYPETGYGYIQAQGNQVLSFKEKPDLATAQQYIGSGNYYWNSGIFCFKAGVFLQELAVYRPDLLQACQRAYAQRRVEENCLRIPIEAMSAIPEDSIDYALLEKSGKIKVVTADMGWSDVGSFDALSEQLALSGQENSILHKGEVQAPVITINAHNNTIITSDHAIAAVDVDDLIIVDTADALLISKKGSSQKVKQIVAQLQQIQPELCNTSFLVYRPWGSYEVLLDAYQYKVKRIVVKPGKKLSLQKHYHRSEHWVVVSGTAEVTLGKQVLTLCPNQSIHIPKGEIHRLENKSKTDLIMIEVQVGEYTGEDDIVRIDDSYGRL